MNRNLPTLLTLSLAVASWAGDVPDTPAGRLARGLLQAVNSGDPVRMRQFALDHVADKPDDVVRLEQALWDESGGVELLDAESRRSLHGRLRARRGGRLADLMLDVDPKSEKIAGIDVVPRPTDEDVRRVLLPKRKASNKAIPSLINRSAEAMLAEGRYSGTVVVLKNGKPILEKAYGLANRELGIANTEHTRYNMASMGKMLTAVAIGQLVDAGKLRLDSTVSELVPDYPNQDAAKKITVRHLLTHMAGLGMIYDSPKFDRSRRYGWGADYYPTYALDPLLFEPGKGNAYSNAGFVLLATIVEKVTGLHYADYLKQRVFGPAGMTETGIYDLDEIIPNMATGYMHSSDDPFGVGPVRSNRAIVPMPGNGCGGGYATAGDMARFASALLAGRLVSNSMRDQLLTVQDGHNYGFGFGLFEAQGKIGAGHSGGGPNIGINSDLEFFKDGSYVVAVMSNSDAPAAQVLGRDIIQFLALQ